MKSQKLVKFFKPDWKKIIFLFIFILIAIGGSIQSWSFGADESGVPKPFLYDILSPFPLWPLWMFLTIPLLIPLLILDSLVLGIFNNSILFSSYVSWVFQAIYFYILACFFVFIISKGMKITKDPGGNKKGIKISLFLILLAFVISFVSSLVLWSILSFYSTPSSLEGIALLFLTPPVFTIFLFLTFNTLAVVITKESLTKKGMFFGYFFSLLPLLLFMLQAFLAIAYH